MIDSISKHVNLRADCKYIPLLLGPVLGFLVYWLLPDSYIAIDGDVKVLGYATKATLSILVWIVVWWAFEAIDLAVTALLPLVIFPVFAIADIQTTANSYASHLIFLFFGGFSLGLAMHRWGLDRRIALRILSIVGSKPANIVAGFMLTTAVLSSFVTNTATTALMLPIALSLLRFQDQQGQESGKNHLALCMLLGIAYAASLGGITTIVGTSPNVFTVGFLADHVGEGGMEISFAAWTAAALPLTLIMLPIIWLLLTRLVFPLKNVTINLSQAWLIQAYRDLGPMNRGEKMTLFVFVSTGSLWIARPWLNNLSVTFAGEVFHPLQNLTDSGISIMALVALFILPVEKNRAVMDWKTMVRMPWGVVLLLGGGLAMAAAIKTNGVTDLLGAQAAGLSHLPDFVILLLLVAIITFATEFASNTATTATLIPVFAALTPVFDLHPLLLVLPTTFAASCAFMMPMATPPNTIVFAAGHIHVPDMIKAGFWGNLAAILVVTLVGYFWIPWLLL